MHILYDEGKKVGELSDWTLIKSEPVYKTFLGKTVLSIPSNDECTFVSPKPVNHKRSKLTVVENGKTEYVLQIVRVTGSTAVAAKIMNKTTLKQK